MSNGIKAIYTCSAGYTGLAMQVFFDKWLQFLQDGNHYISVVA